MTAHASKGVFFDLGRVLLDFDLNPFFAQLAAGSCSDADAVRSALAAEEWLHRYELGEFDDDAFFAGVRRITKYDGDEMLLRGLWTEIFTPMEANIALMQRLLERYPIGLISNTSPLHIAYIEKQFDILQQFHSLTLSYAVRLTKPDRRIFALALSDLRVNAHGSVFIDDIEANLTGASELGMSVIHYRPDVDLSLELSGLGFATTAS